MDKTRLSHALSSLVSPELSNKLVEYFIQIRLDYATRTLGRAAPGKFVESLVQCLQFMSSGTYENKPDVDRYLSQRVESEAGLSEGLRVCAARIARSVYTLRNKRNIAHDNEVDPNTYDLAYVYHASAWIMAELLRNASGLSMQEAGALVALVQAPVSTLVEEIGGTRVVLADVSVRTELLLLLHSHYPDVVPVKDILKSLSRRGATTVRNRLRDLHDEKLAHGNAREGYQLTQAGYILATKEIQARAA